MRPVLDSGLSAFLFSGSACAHAHRAYRRLLCLLCRDGMGVPYYVSPQNQYTPLTGLSHSALILINQQVALP